jgi:hypothetical protein
LPALVQRAKRTQDIPNLKVGDLVIVVDYSTPCGTWPLGRIIEVYRGSDNIVRSVDVKTKFGVFRRPATKIATRSDRPLNDERSQGEDVQTDIYSHVFCYAKYKRVQGPGKKFFGLEMNIFMFSL